MRWDFAAQHQTLKLLAANSVLGGSVPTTSVRNNIDPTYLRAKKRTPNLPLFSSLLNAFTERIHCSRLSFCDLEHISILNSSLCKTFPTG